jgi:hypothetical protein
MKLMTIPNFAYNEGAFTVYFVATFHGLAAIQCLGGYYDTTLGNSWRLGIDASNRPFVYYKDISDVLQATTATSLTGISVVNQPYIIAFRFNAGIPTFRLNATSQTLSSVGRTEMKEVTSLYSLGGLLTGGSPNAAQPLLGGILAHCFYNTSHTAGEMDAVVAELNFRYKAY